MAIKIHSVLHEIQLLFALSKHSYFLAKVSTTSAPGCVITCLILQVQRSVPVSPCNSKNNLCLPWLYLHIQTLAPTVLPALSTGKRGWHLSQSLEKLPHQHCPWKTTHDPLGSSLSHIRIILRKAMSSSTSLRGLLIVLIETVGIIQNASHNYNNLIRIIKSKEPEVLN